MCQTAHGAAALSPSLSYGAPAQRELWSAGIPESAFKFFTEGTNNHDKLQECDLFPSLLSLCCDVLE